MRGENDTSAGNTGSSPVSAITFDHQKDIPKRLRPDTPKNISPKSCCEDELFKAPRSSSVPTPRSSSVPSTSDVAEVVRPRAGSDSTGSNRKSVIRFRDDSGGQAVADIHLIESYKTYNASYEVYPKQKHCCLIL
eukprot:GHVL01008355.1.p1 GENE.GHVL01008355.1~~GHVL01008355.1.p1  ORF type:complete len:135 (-),score=24.61 GHVL01008355.1:51-455(-)